MDVVPKVCGQEAIYIPAPDPCSGGCSLGMISIDSNGNYRAVDEGFDGFSNVVVNVEGQSTSDATLSSGGQMLRDVTAYARGSKYTGIIDTYSGSVNSQAGTIPYYGGSYEVAPSIVSQSFPMAGKIMSSDFVVDAMAISTLSVSANGTYSASDAGFDGFSEVVVNVAGGGTDDRYLIAMGLSTGSIYDSSITNLSSYAFYYCSTITGVEMTAVETIEQSAFQYCFALTSASFSVCTSILTRAFSSCRALENISFPSCITIGECAFCGCRALISINFPKCESISSAAFQTCKSLTTVNFPSCTHIGTSAFLNCDSLTSVSFPVCTYIGQSAFYSCSSLSTASFPVCSTVGTNAFRNCYSLSVINFPLCEYIMGGAFGYCYPLTSVNFPSCVQIAGDAFGRCSALTTAIFPVCSIVGTFAFQYCYNLLSLYLLAPSVCSLVASNAFTSTPIGGYTASTGGVYGSVYVPASLVDAYKSATNWSVFSDRITAYVE